uniref:Uncharacterized protein n=1 Tax=Panagrellus redivivus TaxID=6233 RepID=A0A7E4VDB0_PANRE
MASMTFNSLLSSLLLLILAVFIMAPSNVDAQWGYPYPYHYGTGYDPGNGIGYTGGFGGAYLMCANCGRG